MADFFLLSISLRVLRVTCAHKVLTWLSVQIRNVDDKRAGRARTVDNLHLSDVLLRASGDTCAGEKSLEILYVILEHSDSDPRAHGIGTDRSHGVRMCPLPHSWSRALACPLTHILLVLQLTLH